MESIQSELDTPTPMLDQDPAMTVGGASPDMVHVPESAEELASLLEAAGWEGIAVAPVGGSTHIGIGNPPSRLDWIISTAKLDRCLAYEPPDMTLSIEAGAKLADVQSLLGEHGQALPIEVSDPDKATIGGIIATALYGPKRLGSGTLRDYLIGIHVAYPDGTLAKAGGMVVKNVSGFDLMRMHHGALGTLGVIVSANFKVLPRPRSERTVLASASDLSVVSRQTKQILAGRGRPSSVEVIRQPGWFRIAARVEGRDRTTELLANEICEVIGRDSEVLGPDSSGQYWREYAAGFESGEHVERSWLRMRVKPDQTLLLMERVIETLDGIGASEALVTASPGLGYIDVRQRCVIPEELKLLVSELRALAPKTVIVAAPPDLRHDIDAWGTAIDSLDLMRILKAEFDPNGVLNPGRFVGGL